MASCPSIMMPSLRGAWGSYGCRQAAQSEPQAPTKGMGSSPIFAHPRKSPLAPSHPLPRLAQPAENRFEGAPYPFKV